MPRFFRAPANDPDQAFRAAALAELDALHRFAFHLSRDAATAEDLVQETYVRALASAHTYREGARGVRPWLYKILHNCYRTKLRKTRHAPACLADPHQIADPGPPPDAGPIDWEQVDDRLKQAIDGLSDDLRATFLLAAVEDMKYREIAEVLGVPIGTVMSRLHRARQTLSAALRTNGADRALLTAVKQETDSDA